MASLLNLEDAKTHLKITGNGSDDDVAEKAMQASAIIVDYIKKPDHTWTDETVPYVIKAAICLMLTQLFMDRANATISKSIETLLERSRDPSFA